MSGRGRVLVVDDSLTVRMDLAEALGAAGVPTQLCGSAAEARRALANSAFGVVILDVLLPDGDGIALMEEIRATRAGARAAVMLLSSEAEVRHRVRGVVRGADEYVGKPYDARYVVARACELLRRTESAVASVRTRILVIDDSQTFREALREALEEAGYDVLTAASGEDGLRIAAAARPTALVVDGMLPGIDGPTVIRRLRLDPALRQTPCLLLTASEEGNAELSALDAGADAFVRKDADVGVILARLAAVLRSASQGRAEVETTSLLGPKRILAVDDSATYLDVVATALGRDGYDVVLAASGEEALELLSVQRLDCVLMDLMMPGIGGQEACRRIKSNPATRDTPLIMLTALDDRDAMIDGLGAGADDFIAKSSDLHVLRARVQAQLRRKQFEDETRRIREQLLTRELEAAEARAARQLAEARAALLDDLERKNRELEAFGYSVSHDLRAPLRSIEGFSQALLEDCAAQLDETGKGHVRRVCGAVRRMNELIDDLLSLSRVSDYDLLRGDVDLSALVQSVADDLQRAAPERAVRMDVEPGLHVDADARLVRVLLENLIGNARKFTGKVADPRITFEATHEHGQQVFALADNGVGFDMAYSAKLFAPFQRLHAAGDFPGTGIGLATVYRIVERHGGRVWARGEVGKGARLLFTLTPSKMSEAQ